jgi:hypothetical protein
MKSVSTGKEKSNKQKKIKAQLDKLTQKPELSAGHKPLTQTTIVASMKSGFKEEADGAVAKLFYATMVSRFRLSKTNTLKTLCRQLPNVVQVTSHPEELIFRESC